ncbi:MAG: DUF1385 domain-containing protein [Clostridia bacterium]|nr:DUF1385 domain-containing protein [Clostridia bacterium]
MKKTTTGGQAVIEGVMMKNSKRMAIAVRRPDDQIEIMRENIVPISKRYKIFSIPIFRGMAAFVEALTTGIKSLTASAEMYGEEIEQEQPSKFEKFLAEKTGKDIDDIVMVVSVVIALFLSVFLFIIIPTFAANFLKDKVGSEVLLNLVEGVLRIAIFLIYVFSISRLKDIQRVFEYHGAEHKVIHCYEHEKELTVENARQFTTLHPRCGTNFLLIVMVISILLFSLLGWKDIFYRIITRILLMPIVAGLSYEVIRWAGKSDSKFVKALVYPGLMLQKLTTREPDDKQLEVAIEAFNNVEFVGTGEELPSSEK